MNKCQMGAAQMLESREFKVIGPKQSILSLNLVNE